MVNESEIQRRKKLSETYKKRWQDPEYRKKMIEKQKRVGYRTYPTISHK